MTAPPGRALVRLSLLTAALVAASTALVVLARVRRDGSADLPFDGWQVAATEAASAVLLLIAAGAAALALRAPWRALSGRTPLRAPVALVAAMAGLGMGGLARPPLEHLAGWASERTADAAAARAAFLAWQRNDGPTPALEPAPPSAQPAPQAVAALLLRAQDLGSRWYPTQHPNPYTVRVAATPGTPTPLLRVRLSLTQHHHAEGRWHRDRLLWEDVTRFASPAEAGRALALRERFDPDGAWRQVAGVHVWQGRSAAFSLGRDLFVLQQLQLPGGQVPPAVPAEVVAAAVQRAAGAQGA